MGLIRFKIFAVWKEETFLPLCVKKYFPFISSAKMPTIIPETRQGARDGESEGQP